MSNPARSQRSGNPLMLTRQANLLGHKQGGKWISRSQWNMPSTKSNTGEVSLLPWHPVPQCESNQDLPNVLNSVRVNWGWELFSQILKFAWSNTCCLEGFANMCQRFAQGHLRYYDAYPVPEFWVLCFIHFGLKTAKWVRFLHYCLMFPVSDLAQKETM